MTWLLKLLAALPAKFLMELVLGLVRELLGRKDLSAAARARVEAELAALVVKAHETAAAVDARHRDLTFDDLRGPANPAAPGPVPPAPTARGGP